MGHEVEHDGESRCVHHVAEVRDGLTNPEQPEGLDGEDLSVRDGLRHGLAGRLDGHAPTLADDLFQRPTPGRVVPRARQLTKLPDRFLRRLYGWTEDPGLGDGVEGIAGIDDAGPDWDRFASQPIRVAGTVPALMVVADNQGDVLLLGMFSEDLSALDRMLLDDFVFLGRQLPRLEEDRVGDRNLSQVMQDAADSDGVANIVGHPEHSSDGFAELADPLGMTEGLAVALVNNAALHDVRVPEPGVEAPLLLHAGAVDEKRAVKEEHDEPGEPRTLHQLHDEDPEQGHGEEGQRIAGQSAPQDGP